MRLGREAHPSVNDRCRTGCEFLHEAFYICRINACDALYGHGTKRLNPFCEILFAFKVRPQGLELYVIIAIKHMQKCEEKIEVCCGPNEMMLAGDFGCLGLARVNDDKFAAAPFNVFKAIRHPGRGHDTAITGQRVRAHNDHVIRTVDVRDRNSELMTKHKVTREMMRELIHRCRGIYVFGAQRLSEGFHK